MGGAREPALWVFRHLVDSKIVGGARIPETVLFEGGNPVLWVYTAQGAVHSREFEPKDVREYFYNGFSRTRAGIWKNNCFVPQSLADVDDLCKAMGFIPNTTECLQKSEFASLEILSSFYHTVTLQSLDNRMSFVTKRLYRGKVYNSGERLLNDSFRSISTRLHQVLSAATSSRILTITIHFVIDSTGGMWIAWFSNVSCQPIRKLVPALAPMPFVPLENIQRSVGNASQLSQGRKTRGEFDIGFVTTPKSLATPINLRCHGDLCCWEIKDPVLLEENRSSVFAMALTLLDDKEIQAIKNELVADSVTGTLLPAIYSISNSSIIQARNDGVERKHPPTRRSSVNAELPSLGEDGPEPNFRTPTHSSAIHNTMKQQGHILNSLPQNYYQSVPVCYRCYVIYNALDNVRKRRDSEAKNVQTVLPRPRIGKICYPTGAARRTPKQLKSSFSQPTMSWCLKERRSPQPSKNPEVPPDFRVDETSDDSATGSLQLGSVTVPFRVIRNPGRPVLLFVHDLLDGMDKIEQCYSDLFPEYQVVMWNYPGQWDTQFSKAGQGPSTLATVLAILLERLESSFLITSFQVPFFVLGIGFGCSIVQEFAQQYPERADRCLFVNPMLYRDAALSELVADLEQVFSVDRLEDSFAFLFLLHFLFSEEYFDSTPLFSLLWHFELCNRRLPLTNVRFLLGCLKSLPELGQSPRFPLPPRRVAVLHSQQDRLVSKDYYSRFVSSLCSISPQPSDESVPIIESIPCGHEIAVEKPMELSAFVRCCLAP